MNKNVSIDSFVKPDYEVARAHHRHFPDVHQLVTAGREDLVNIKVTYRGNDEFLAIAKRYGGDGSLQVCFGGGSDFYSALSALQSAVASGRWKPDKYSQSSA